MKQNISILENINTKVSLENCCLVHCLHCGKELKEWNSWSSEMLCRYCIIELGYKDCLEIHYTSSGIERVSNILEC